MAEPEPEQVTDLEVTVTVTKKIVQPGKSVELEASVKGVSQAPVSR